MFKQAPSLVCETSLICYVLSLPGVSQPAPGQEGLHGEFTIMHPRGSLNVADSKWIHVMFEEATQEDIGSWWLWGTWTATCFIQTLVLRSYWWQL